MIESGYTTGPFGRLSSPWPWGVAGGSQNSFARGRFEFPGSREFPPDQLCDEILKPQRFLLSAEYSGGDGPAWSESFEIDAGTAALKDFYIEGLAWETSQDAIQTTETSFPQQWARAMISGFEPGYIYTVGVGLGYPYLAVESGNVNWCFDVIGFGGFSGGIYANLKTDDPSPVFLSETQGATVFSQEIGTSNPDWEITFERI